MGRIPKLVKERALREQREQELKEKATENPPDEGRARESSCSSSTSDRSVENYDPIKMETGRNERKGISVLLNPSRLETAKLSLNNDDEKNSNEQSNLKHIAKKKKPDLLPEDFIIDETIDLPALNVEPLPRPSLELMRSLAEQIRGNPTNVSLKLTDEQTNLIEFIRHASHQIFVRHSRRVNQLEARMEKMVLEGIDDSLDDTATVEDFLGTVPSKSKRFFEELCFL